MLEVRIYDQSKKEWKNKFFGRDLCKMSLYISKISWKPWYEILIMENGEVRKYVNDYDDYLKVTDQYREIYRQLK